MPLYPFLKWTDFKSYIVILFLLVFEALLFQVISVAIIRLKRKPQGYLNDLPAKKIE